MSRSAAVLLMLTLAGAALFACSGDEDPFPERPFRLDVGSVDPCRALTARQLTELGLRSGSAGVAQGGTSRGCTWPGDNGVGFTFQTLAVDADRAIGAEPTSLVVTVAGFGAVQSSPPATGTGLPFCQVVLDVADGAALRAQVQVTPLAPDAAERSVEGTCHQVRELAGLVVANLRAQQPD